MRTILRLFGVATIAATLAGCGVSSGNSSHGTDFELKMYKVPAAQSKAIAGKLDGILASPEFLVGTKTHTTMRATTPFPGTVLVLAPASVQPSIATAVAELAQAAGSASSNDVANEGKTKSPESVPLRVQFWVVQARAGAGEDAPALRPLETTLKQVRESLGPSHFVLEDIASALVNAPVKQNLAAGNGTLVTSRGHNFGFHVTAPAGADVGLEVNYGNATADAASRTIPELKTTVGISPGEYVVLAQASPSAGSNGASDTTLMNLLVVRVDRMAPASH